MRNFPHQINNLDRFRAALTVLAQLVRTGANIDDDGVVGRAMVVAGVYEFRDKSLEIPEALEIEERKPTSSQGTRAFARDIRRFFILLGFLEEVPGGGLQLTERAHHLLHLNSDSADAQALWRTALRQLTLIDDGGQVSHPYQIMLRLIEEIPDIETAKLGLALEAIDDSDEEFQRVLNLARRADWIEELKNGGASDHMIRNSVKVLPAIARQLSDIQEQRGVNRLSPSARQRRRDYTDNTHAAGNRHRSVTVATIASAPVRQQRSADEEDYVDPQLTRELRLARLEKHNEIVRAFAGIVVSAGYSLFEHPYDLLAIHRAHPALLVEVKTLDGSDIDETARVRGAVAQLLYYDWFSVPADDKINGLVKAAVFGGPISEGHQAFLQSNNIAVLWLIAERFVGPEWSVDKMEQLDVILGRS